MKAQTKIDGGSAFPHPRKMLDPDFGETVEFQAAPGMTLREHYAGLAMAAFISFPGHIGSAPAKSAKLVALVALEYTDALLAALAEGK